MVENQICPVCGEACERISAWYESKADDEDEFRTITHESDGPFVTDSCTERR